jgi:hypothetical protein
MAKGSVCGMVRLSVLMNVAKDILCDAYLKTSLALEPADLPALGNPLLFPISAHKKSYEHLYTLQIFSF